jgi:hypothetical protein
MIEKNHGKWTNRPAVQKAFGADPQRAYHAVASVITKEQAALIEEILVPPLDNDEIKFRLVQAREALVLAGMDTTALDSKVSELSR